MITETAVDKRGRTWEMINDVSAHEMWCVRCVDVPHGTEDCMSFHFDRLLRAEVFMDCVKEAM